MTGTMIESKGLRRVYKARKEEVEAVRGVDFTVEKGEIVGFLGPNGAGKTTTLRMLTTLLEPTGGGATVAGCDLRLDPVGVRRSIGYVAQGGSTDPEARAGEEIVDHARMYGIDAATARDNGRRLFEQLDLDGMWQRQAKTLSGGQRRRLDIAMGLVHRPGLIFLDEPSTGLDPQSRANLWEHIERLRADLDTTVFLTTHYMDEADVLCDRILVIDNGSIVAQGSPDDLKRRVAGDSVVVSFDDQRSSMVAAELASHLEGATDPVIEGSEVRFQVPDGASALPALLRMMVERDLDATGVQVHRPTLDDVFLTMTGRSLRDVAISAQVSIYVTDDVASARDRERPHIAFYIGGMGVFYHQYMHRIGFGAEADRVRAAFSAKDRDGAARLVTDEADGVVPPPHGPYRTPRAESRLRVGAPVLRPPPRRLPARHW